MGSPIRQRQGCSTNEFNNYFKLLTQMETQHQMKLNNLRKQINQLKADKIEVGKLFCVSHFLCLLVQKTPSN